jgi:hypothetical protein
VGFSRPCLHMQSRNLPADRDAGKSPRTPRSAYPMAGPCSTEARHDVDAARTGLFLGDWRRPAIMQVWIKLAEQADEESRRRSLLAAPGEHDTAVAARLLTICSSSFRERRRSESGAF